MNVIPVIDLMDGVVVRARRGERGSYQPIRSGLAAGSGPLAIAAGLMRLAPFRTLYVADLDAIRGRGGHERVISALAAAHPRVEIWADRGETDAEALAERAALGDTVAVVGTEAFEDERTLGHALAASRGVLSLDSAAAGPLGPASVHQDPALWPDRVILMTLARVGAGEGPDFEWLARVLDMAGGRKIYAAGGVRDAADLAALAMMGVAGALVASALHDGRITASDLADLSATPPRTAPPR
jgi:phosphoribosylformimino-5-aminoimidazole carboxamide ribotide isomerase